MDLEDLSNEKLLAFDRRGRQGEDMPTNKFTLAENKASAPFKLKSTDALALDFDKLDKKGLKSLVDRFKRRKRPVSEIEANNKAKRANGVLQKQFTLTFEDGQKLTFAIKSDGTIFQVRLNNKVMPLRNTTDMTKAVEEMVNAMLANSSAYEKAKAAREKAKIRPPKPKVVTTRKQKIAEGKAQLESLGQHETDLQKQYDDLVGQIVEKLAELDRLEKALEAENKITTELENEIAELEKKGATLLLPAVNLKTAGTFRDVSKWPARDKRTGLRTDRIIYDFPGPYLVRKMLSGRKILEDLLHGPADISGNYACKGMLIPERAASKGLALYGMAIDKFLGDSLIKWFAAAGCLKGFMEELSDRAGSLPEDDFSGGIAGWTDLAGLAAPVAEADGLLDRIENGDISSVGDLENRFSEIAGNYDRDARMWTCGLIMRFYGKEGFSYKGIMEIIGKWKEAARSLFMMVMDDSKKEYSDEFAVSACPDRGDEVRNADFRQARGDFDSSSLAESLKSSFGQALADGEALESAVSEACREAGACGNRK